MARAYWKRFAALGTGYARKYQFDPFFRTEVNIIALQVLFSFAIIALIGAALALLYQSTLAEIIANTQSNILNAPNLKQDHLIPIPSFADVQSGWFLLIVGIGALITIGFGYVITRTALAPTKNALASQKQFIGNIAHELRTPLSIIKTNTEVRMFDTAISDDARELHQGTLEELDRISEIINNLLSLDTLVRPGGLEFTQIDLGTVIEKMVGSLSEFARRKKISVTTRLSDFRRVSGNEIALEQVVLNILKNAISYTPEEGHVSIAVEPDYRGSVILTIQDSGIGIPEKDLFKIFEPFYRGSASRTRHDGGSGLGLAIVSELVRIHGGEISVRSILKRGTTVTVSLPAAEKRAKNTDEKEGQNGSSKIEMRFPKK